VAEVKLRSCRATVAKVAKRAGTSRNDVEADPRCAITLGVELGRVTHKIANSDCDLIRSLRRTSRTQVGHLSRFEECQPALALQDRFHYSITSSARARSVGRVNGECW
jgi:hypothetical protein